MFQFVSFINYDNISFNWIEKNIKIDHTQVHGDIIIKIKIKYILILKYNRIQLLILVNNLKLLNFVLNSYLFFKNIVLYTSTILNELI